MDESNSFQPSAPSDGTPPAPPGPPANPPQPGSSVDFGRSLSFFFQDPDWVKKILLGSLFSLLAIFIVGSFFVAGYMVRLIRRSARGEAYPLPEWDDLGGIFVDGAMAVGAYFVYVMPIILLYVVGALGLGIGLGGDDPSIAVSVLLAVLVLFFALLMLCVVFYFPAALIRLALAGNFGAAFEVRPNWEFIRRNIGNYLLAFLIVFLANLISQFGILLFCIGIIPASFWATSVSAFALGEVALRDRSGQLPTAPAP